jgi:hypothetical protein
MSFDIGQVDLQVRAVDDRTLLSPDVMEVVVREVLARLEAQAGTRQRQREDVQVWGSVRDGADG